MAAAPARVRPTRRRDWDNVCAALRLLIGCLVSQIVYRILVGSKGTGLYCVVMQGCMLHVGFKILLSQDQPNPSSTANLTLH